MQRKSHFQILADQLMGSATLDLAWRTSNSQRDQSSVIEAIEAVIS
jgi:hypothetical protein